MNTSEEIDRIVKEVIRRLRLTTKATFDDKTLRVTEKLISLSTIEGRLSGISQFVVPQKAVITPSVHDELRSRQIEIIRQDACVKRKCLLLANFGDKDQAQLLKNEPIEIKPVKCVSIEAAVDDMAKQLTETTSGLMLVDQPEMAVCLSNRSTNVRSFVGHNSMIVQRAKSFGCNLMVVDASYESSTIRDLVRKFVD